MSGFSFSDLASLGAMANESLNAVVSPMYYGDVRRVFSGVALTEDGPSHNDFLLGPGEHQGFKVEKPLGSLRGEPGAIVTELATFKSITKVDGLFFKQGKNNTSHLAAVQPGAKVVFSNCIFQRDAGAESSSAATSTFCFVLVSSGAKAVFTNCVFQSTAESGAMSAAAGLAIQDLNGGAGNVFVGLGANYSGHGHAGTVTNLGGEIT
jgi:hypothetical protein